MSNPFANMSKPAKIATAVGGTAAVGFALWQRHKNTGTWNPFSSGAAAASDASSAGTSALGSDAGGGDGDLAQIPVTGSSADLSTSSPYTLNATYPSAAAWAQAAQAGLTSIGYDPETVAAALGAYINGGLLTAAQESIVQTATAEYTTPVGANGLPIPILTQPAVTTSTGTSSTPATVEVPDVAGMTADQAETVLRSEHLNPKITLTASSDKPGIYHIITKTSPAAGAQVAPNTTVVLYYRDSTNS
jgi:hypothetical protein